MYNLIIIGGGAAGIFAAINAKKQNNNAKIIVLEKTSKPLSKVTLSGGGRCNFSHACFTPQKLASYYPRGHKELIGPFNRFQPKDMIFWLEEHNIKTNIETDGRIFPQSNSSSTIVNTLLDELKKLNIELLLNQNIKSIEKSKDNNFLIITNETCFQANNILLATGSSKEGFNFAKNLGHTIIPPIPSLYALQSSSSPLRNLSGITVENVETKLKNTNFKITGPLLLTHFGFSGYAIINLSALSAKYLFENNYKTTLIINWLPTFPPDKILNILLKLKTKAPQKKLYLENAFNLPKNLWKRLLQLTCSDCEKPLFHFSNKQLHDISEKLHADHYLIDNKSPIEEFVTCGGINLKEIDFKNMQSKLCPRLFFAGEILNIDGLTGGFNLQNAWTTGFIAGTAVVS
jgi:predicted Rossmann fold flavoprotein